MSLGSRGGCGAEVGELLRLHRHLNAPLSLRADGQFLEDVKYAWAAPIARAPAACGALAEAVGAPMHFIE